MKYQLITTIVLSIVLILFTGSCQKKQEKHESKSNQYELAKKAYFEKRYSDAKSLFLKVKDLSQREHVNSFLEKIDSIENSNPLNNPKESKIITKNNPLDLSQQKVMNWKKASTSDKMIVCTAFVNEFNKLSPKHLSAIDVMNCIDEATRGINSTNDIPVGTMMTLCSQEILK